MSSPDRISFGTHRVCTNCKGKGKKKKEVCRVCDGSGYERIKMNTDEGTG